MIHRIKAFLQLFNVFTLIIWAWMVLEFFFSKTQHLPASLTALYLTLVGVYVGDKEYQRLRRRFSSRNRRGELFVLLWLITLIGIAAFLGFGGNSNGYHMPQDLPIISGTVLVLWLTSEYLKGQTHHRQRS